MPDRFPRDAPLARVLAALKALGVVEVRSGNHISMRREDADGTVTPLTLPGHKTLKSSTLRLILRQSRIGRAEFLDAYDAA